MSMEYLITTSVNASLASAWNDCLNAADFATHYTAPEFLDENYFRASRPFAVLAMDAGTVIGVVTGYFAGADMVCGASGSPHICVRRGANLEDVGRVLAAGLRAHARSAVKFMSAYAWTQVPGFETAGFRLRKIDVPLCTILLDLSKGTDWLFRQCSETRRNKIRRAIKAGVQVTEMDFGRDFDEYYDLYRHWCGFKNVTCHPYELQRSVLETRGNRLILVARHEGRLLGVSSFRYRRPGVVEYAANVSRREESRLRQNDLLLWRGIEWSVQQGGFSHFSMAGAHFFLQKFGGDTHTTYGYSLDRTFLRTRDTVAGVRTAAMRLYRRLPEPVKRAAKRLLQRGSTEA